MAYGTDDGVYISDLQNPNREPVKVLALLDVSQIDVLEYHQLLIVLSGRTPWTCSSSCPVYRLCTYKNDK